MSNWGEIRTQYLTCPSCHEEYNNSDKVPRVLTCLHALCENCCTTNLDGAAIVCPKCNQRTRLPSEQIKGLPFETTWKRMKDFVDVNERPTSIPCKECPDKKKATSFCKNCCYFLCDTCSEYHTNRRSRESKDHNVASLEEIKTKIDIFQQRTYCPEHIHQQLTFYCASVNCFQPICLECTIVKHDKVQGHNIRTLIDVYPERATQVQSLIKLLHDQIKDIDGATHVLEETKASLQKQVQETLAEIDLEFDECIHILDNRRQVLSQDVNVKEQTVQQRLNNKTEELDDDAAQRSNAKYFANHIVQVSNKEEFLQLSHHITQQLEQLNSYKFNRHPIEKQKLTFGPKMDIGELTGLCNADEVININSLSVWKVEVEMFDAVVLVHTRSKIAQVKFVARHGEPSTCENASLKAIALDSCERRAIDVEVDDDEKENGIFTLFVTAGITDTYTLRISIDGESVSHPEYCFSVAEQSSEEENDKEIRMDEDPFQKAPCEKKTITENEANGSDVLAEYKTCKCINLTIDKDTVPSSIQVSDDGKTLKHNAYIQRGDRQLKVYDGGIGTICFGRDITAQVRYRVRVNYKIVEQLEKVWAVFEVGLSGHEHIDKISFVYIQQQGLSFRAANCTKHNSVCCRMVTSGEEIYHDRLSDNTAGTEVDVTYNFLLDTTTNTWTVEDSDDKILCFANGVDFDQCLWPVFGIYNASSIDAKLHLSSTKGHQFTIDKDTVHRRIHVSDDGRTLSLVDSIQRGDRQLKQYGGGRGTISFTRGTVKLSAYFQVKINYRIKRQWEKAWLVFEVGLCRQEHIDKTQFVGTQPHAISFRSYNCEEHTGVCAVLTKADSSVFHSRLSSNTVGTEIDITYGFLLEVEKKYWTVVDCDKNTVLCVVKDVNLDQPMWPVFGIYNPRKQDITMTLITEDSIAMPSCIKHKEC